MENDGTSHGERKWGGKKALSWKAESLRCYCCWEAEVTMKQLLQISSGIKANVWSFSCSNNAFTLGPEHWNWKHPRGRLGKSFSWNLNKVSRDPTLRSRPCTLHTATPQPWLTLCAVTANCSALFIISAVLSSARPNRSPRSFRAWLAFCTALVTLSAAECRILLPEDEETSQEKPKSRRGGGDEEKRRRRETKEV